MVEDQVKTQNEANLKFMDVEKKSKTSYAKYFPNVIKEMQEWGDIRQRLATNPRLSYYFNITTYTADNAEASLATDSRCSTVTVRAASSLSRPATITCVIFWP
jgi:conjugal transfer ATP-binding protein TraC